MADVKYKHIKKDKTKPKILAAVIVCLLVIAGIVGAIVYSKSNKPVVEEPVEEVVQEVKNSQPERQLWLDNKKINDDYIGEIVFESNLINKPFVQAKDVYDKNGELYRFYTESGSLVTNPEGYSGNDVYIYTNWTDMSYDFNILGGSVFMDYRNDINDQNIIIYGHHFSKGGGNDPERIKSFTPLELLLDEENFKGNEKVKLILDNETRIYEIASVYIYDITDDFYNDSMQYYRTFYDYDIGGNEDPGYYENYIQGLNKVKLYDTGVDLTVNDRTLTLQTCIGGSTTQFEIIVLKETNVELFD